MIDFRTARPLPARYYSFHGVAATNRDRYARRSVAAERSGACEKARRNFLRLFNRPRRTFFEFTGRRGAARRGSAAGWYLARPVSLVFFCSQRETSENSPRRSHAAGDFQRVYRAVVIRCRGNTLVPEMRNTMEKCIEFYFDTRATSETYRIFIPLLNPRETGFLLSQ